MISSKIFVAIIATLLASGANASACKPSVTCTQALTSGLVCGQNGQVSNAGQPFPVDNKISVEDCAAFCYARLSCQTFYIDSGSCTLYDTDSQGYTLTGSSSGLWYNLDCFSCSNPSGCRSGNCQQR